MKSGLPRAGAALGPDDKEYRFDTDAGTASLVDPFQGRTQLLIYHFMFSAR